MLIPAACLFTFGVITLILIRRGKPQDGGIARRDRRPCATGQGDVRAGDRLMQLRGVA